MDRKACSPVFALAWLYAVRPLTWPAPDLVEWTAYDSNDAYFRGYHENNT